MLLVLLAGLGAQDDNAIDPNGKSYIRVGSFQTHISAYGAERAWTGSYYEGLIWPADYLYQDNAVIKRSFLAIQDWTDEIGETWEYWGTYISLGRADDSLFPVRLTQSTRFEMPLVTVDGNNLTAPFMDDVTEEDAIPEQKADRVVVNTVNTYSGLTFTRRIHAFSQQYHDNYIIKEIILKNTGNTDYDDEIELTNTIYGARVGWSVRYSVSRDGASTMGDGSQKWGKHTWVTKRGEDYASHQGEMFTEADGIQDWIRQGFCYLGQNEASVYSTIGAPDLYENGRLCSPHHVGLGILQVPVSASDTTDDATQPAVLGWHAGDTYPSGGSNNQGSIPAMKLMWDFLDGVPFGVGMGGDDRMDETYMTDPLKTDPYTVHRDGGGTNLWTGYGPFDIPHGDSVVIVEVEGISGLDREKCIQIGRKWYEAYKNPSTSYDFTMPDGSTKSGTYADGSADEYKNSWVFTGKDSIMKTIGRAYRNYKSGFNIPQPPRPPITFDVTSGGDKITLSWGLSPDDGNSDFAGYRIYRAMHKPDTVHELLATVGSGITIYEDRTPSRGLDYYYYITAVNDGSNNTSGELNPPGPLESNRFYTKTTEPANLKRKQGVNLKDIVVVPNPYNFSARDLQYGESGIDQIGFLNIPGQCIIKIYSERGDLIETLHHDEGSGDIYWNSISSARQVVVSGLYIAYFEVSKNIYDEETGKKIFSKGENTYRKFIIVR